jgi:hypothetical protein
VQIDITYDSSVNSAPAAFKTDIQTAVQYLDNEFTNPVTINIDVGYGEIDDQSLGSGDLGESLSARYEQESYSAVANILTSEAAPGAFTLPANSPDQGNLVVSPAEAKALGFLTNNGSVDGYIGFSSDPNTFSYSVGTAPPSNEYYFIGVVEHEITEDMGRVSYLDEQPSLYSLTDLFRYSSPGVRDLTTGGTGSTAYFSIDNGDTNLGSWNNNPNNGDLADWYGSNIPNGGDDAFDDYDPPGIVTGVSQSDVTLMQALGWTTAAQQQPPPGTTADMIMRDAGNGDYEIYDIGNNALLVGYSLGQVGGDWQIAGVGSFNGSDTADMLLRDSNTGAFEVYDINNNQVTYAAGMGQVGLNWTVAGFGDFSGNANETDMLLRNGDTGAFEVYDISNNQVTYAAGMGQVGSNWTVAGFGDFSGSANETDMLLRDSDTGAFEVYDISNNQVTYAAGMGQVGLNWTVAGFGDFSGNANETDMLLRDSDTGAFEVYDISSNQVTHFTGLGQVGLDWTVAGFGDFSGNANETDMLLRDNNTGQFEVYDISDNKVISAASMGGVGTQWLVGGIASDPPAASGDPAVQLAQAMASYSPARSFVSSGLNSGIDTQPPRSNYFAAPPHAT